MIKSFSGLRNDVTAERFKPGDLALANNVNLDNSGKLLSRGGYLKKITGAFHSLWAHEGICLFVSGTELRSLNASLTSSALVRADLSSGLPMSYVAVNGRVYYSNGKQAGVYSPDENRSWGIAPPVFQPLAVAGYGLMDAGTYQFAMTYVRGDGQESGTGLADSIELTTGAINFTDIPVSPDPDVTHKIIYLTPANGDVLYRALILNNATTSATFNSGDLFTPLTTQFLQQAPAGHLVGYAFGHTFVASGAWLHYSKPYNYELFDLRNYMGFDSTITLFGVVKDGIWIGTEQSICFLQGRDPAAMIKFDKANYGAVPGTLAMIHTSQIKGLEKLPEETVPVWTSHSGICCGLSEGALINLTQDRYEMDASGSQGAAIYRTVDGIGQYLSVLRS